jgi:hypothetical protein
MATPVLAADDRRAIVSCTGVTAAWCPVCGDCTCLGGEEHQRLALIPLDKPGCPLHDPLCAHAEPASQYTSATGC